MEKTSLEIAIEEAKDIEESYFRNEIRGNYEVVKRRLLEIASTSSIFSQLVNESRNGEVTRVEIKLSGIEFGRIFLDYNSFNESVKISASNSRINEHREEFILIERDNHIVVAHPQSDSHILIKEPMLANGKFIELLITKLVERIVANFDY